MQTTVLDALSFDEAEVEELEVTGSVVIDEGAKLSLRKMAPSTLGIATIGGDNTGIKFAKTISGATAIQVEKGSECVVSLGEKLPHVYVAYAKDNMNVVDITLAKNGMYALIIPADTEATYVVES